MYLSTFARQNKKLKCFLQLLAKRIVRHLHGDIISQAIDSKAKEVMGSPYNVTAPYTQRSWQRDKACRLD